MAKLVKSGAEVFDYADVRLIPGQCVLTSRSEANTTVKFGDRTFEIPVVPANMSTIIGEKLAFWLAHNGYFYIHHRFDVDPVDFTSKAHDAGFYSSISLGVKSDDVQAVHRLADAGQVPEYITIDIAHGDAATVTTMVRHIRQNLPATFIIAGNIGTPEGVKRIEDSGAHAIKVGIGPGAACLTAPQTGFGTRDWQLSALEWCANAADEALIVADGGIRRNGDIAKSVAFGADMVMVGSMLSGHDENPGEIVEDEVGHKFVTYFGSASEFQKGERKHVEGKKLLMPYKGSIAATLGEIRDNLQSAISYAGGRKLHDLRDVGYVKLDNQ